MVIVWMFQGSFAPLLSIPFLPAACRLLVSPSGIGHGSELPLPCLTKRWVFFFFFFCWFVFMRVVDFSSGVLHVLRLALTLFWHPIYFSALPIQN